MGRAQNLGHFPRRRLSADVPRIAQRCLLGRGEGAEAALLARAVEGGDVLDRLARLDRRVAHLHEAGSLGHGEDVAEGKGNSADLGAEAASSRSPHRLVVGAAYDVCVRCVALA